jgi:hypothetical protein
MIDFEKPYNSLLSCLEYIDLMRERLLSVENTIDEKKLYGVLRQISQMNKGVIDIGGWQENDRISALLVQITDNSIDIIREKNL